MGHPSSQNDQRPLILSFETATRAGSIAIMRGSSVVASLPGRPEESHSINLLRDTEALLSGAELKLDDINLFATALGPGSFTGLRIGLATVKAFSQMLDRPCIGVPTLYAVALAAGVSPKTYALLPAGRGEVFSQLLRVTLDGAVQPLGPAEHLPPHELLARIDGMHSSLRWAGAGAHLFSEAIRERAHEMGIDFADEMNEKPASAGEHWTLAYNCSVLAETVAVLAAQQFKDDSRQGPDDLFAIYVRPSDAELNK